MLSNCIGMWLVSAGQTIPVSISQPSRAQLVTLTCWDSAGGEEEEGRGRPQKGRGQKAPRGNLRCKEGQEGLHDPREKEETQGKGLASH